MSIGGVIVEDNDVPRLLSEAYLQSKVDKPLVWIFCPSRLKKVLQLEKSV